jgi:hypothetical protein
MARLIDHDFSRLEVFLDNYTLSDVLKSKVREQLIRRGHKYCLSALQIWAIAEQLASIGVLHVNGTPLKQATPQLDQIAESFSDLTSALFAALHGLYKPAHMSLRSAIETFVRGITGLYSVEAAGTTSVYRLFELARVCVAFSKNAAPHFEVLYQQYVQLCGFTHSATSAHMVKNHAISSFPKQDIESLRNWVRHNEVTIKAMLSVLVFANKSLYLNASPQAQDVYEETIPREARLFALGAPNH